MPLAIDPSKISFYDPFFGCILNADLTRENKSGFWGVDHLILMLSKNDLITRYELLCKSLSYLGEKDDLCQ